MTKKKKILVVEDNETFLGVLSIFLTENGYEVLKSPDGKDALIQYNFHLPDIIVTDIIMPEIDGIQLLTNLLNINPGVKVIAMSGGNRGHADTYLEMAENLGACSVLSKPFELPELLKEIKRLEN